MSEGERRLRLVDQKGLARVAEFREAARRILRNTDLTIESRETALMRLYQRAKLDSFADLLVGAIVAEVLWSIEREDLDPLRATGDRLERAHRSLRGRGYARCPECMCELSRELDWSLWGQERRAAINEFEAREGAVT